MNSIKQIGFNPGKLFDSLIDLELIEKARYFLKDAIDQVVKILNLPGDVEEQGCRIETETGRPENL